MGSDGHDLRFHVRSVRAGVALSVVTAGFALVYLAWTWDRPNRLPLALVAGLALAASPLLLALPLRRILDGGRAPWFFLSWSGVLVPTIAVLVALDGGAASPLVSVLFLPLVFAAIAYPLRSTVLVGALVVAAYLIVALRSVGHADASVFVVACSLTTATWLCGWQARNHERQRLELARVSRADPLTGCLNRRGLEERIAAEVSRAGRAGLPLSVVLVDLDRFKEVNDREGHAAGDRLLCWVVERIAATVRPIDAVGRIGGDEFAVLLPEADAVEAAEIAERVAGALRERAAGSVGTATFPEDGEDVDGLYACADTRLYDAKAGRRPAPAVE